MADGNTRERAGTVLFLPSIPELENVPSRIDEADERDIRHHLENPSVATITQSSGAFGGQLERAEAYGYGALPCRGCGGKWKSEIVTKNGEVVGGVDDEPTVEFPVWREGTGRQPRLRLGKRGRRETYAMALARYRVQQRLALRIVIGTFPKPSAESGFDAQALWDATVDSYWARGEALVTEADFREAFDELPAEWTEICEQCDGIGVVPRRTSGFRREEVTAWPKGSSVGEAGRENLDADGLLLELEAGGDVHDGNALVRVDALAHWMGVEAVLRDVAGISPIAREGIERLYGPQDDKRSWGRLGLIELAGSASKVGELQDHLSQCWNFCAYGAES
jgi:hypothetical protein